MPATKDYSLREGTPDAATFNALRRAGGLTPYSQESAEAGLRGTVFGVVLDHAGEAVGMGRIIGDGGCTFQIADIVIHPDHQGQGLAHRIMGALSEHIQDALPAGAYVSLIADLPADGLYAQYGFTPTAPASIGMARWAGPAGEEVTT